MSLRGRCYFGVLREFKSGLLRVHGRERLPNLDEVRKGARNWNSLPDIPAQHQCPA